LNRIIFDKTKKPENLRFLAHC